VEFGLLDNPILKARCRCFIPLKNFIRQEIDKVLDNKFAVNEIKIKEEKRELSLIIEKY
jgi:UDP-N-acetylglucosamine pyrophosphorylase